MKKELILASVVALISVALMWPNHPCQAAPRVKLVCGTTGVPDVTTYWAAEELKARVERYSNGEIIIEHHGASVLGGDVKLAQSVRLGTIDIGSVSNANWSSVGKALQPFDLPYMVNGTMNFYRVITNPNIRAIIEKKIEQDGFKYLMFFPIGPVRHMFNSRREVRVPADAKGLRIRATASPIEQQLIKAWGFLPVAVDWAETYTSIQQGICDGVYTPEMWVFGVKINEITRYETTTGGCGIWHLFPMNMGKWKSLSPKDQATITQAAREAELAAFIYDQYLETRGRRMLAESGVKIYNPTLEEMKLWMAPAQKLIDESIQKMNLDKEFIKLVKDAQIPLEKY